MRKVSIILIALLIIFSVGVTVFILGSNKKQKIGSQSMPLDNVEKKTASEQYYYPLAKGNHWEYEVSNKEEQNEGSISATIEREVVEIINVRQDTSGKYIDVERRNIDELGKENVKMETWLVRERTIYDFTNGEMSENTITYPFPFYTGQKWGDDEDSLRYREDGFYNWKVESKFPLKVLDKDYPECFRIVYNTLGSSAYKIFCYGLGVAEEGYTHNGYLQESKRKLVSAFITGQTTCLNITEEQAVKATNELPEVKEFMQDVGKLGGGYPDKVVEGAGLTGNQKLWRTHVFSISEMGSTLGGGANSRTATFNWYQVDKCTGKVVCADNEHGTKLGLCKSS